MSELWVAVSTFLYPDESYKDTLISSVEIFHSKEEAVACLNKTIRENWTVEVAVATNGKWKCLVTKSLADCRGLSEFGGKHSSWSYSEDGCLAWAFFEDGHGYKGEVTRLEVK